VLGFSSRRFGLILARLIMLAVATAAIGWTMAVMPKFWSEVTAAQTATHIIAGESFKPEIMESLATDLEYNRGSALRSSIMSKAAIIRLRRAEDAITAGDPQVINASLNALHRVIDDVLTNAPSDPYQWLVLFWLNDTRNGFELEHLRYLRMSYALGPNEGWIAIKRNRLALAIFPMLPIDLKEAAITEFVGLVRSQLYIEAVDIMVGPGWPIRQLLLARLNGLKEFDRRAFAKLLYKKNVDDITVPGIEMRPLRPWQ
jgi:hypothetical protein